MKNYFKLEGDELARYHENLNSICNEFNYNDYRFFYDLVTKESIDGEDVVEVLYLTRPWCVDDNIYEEYCTFYKFYESAIDKVIEGHLIDEGIDEEDKMYEHYPFYEYKTIEVDDQYISFVDNYIGMDRQSWEEMGKDVSIVSKEDIHIREYVENIVNSAIKNPHEISYWLEKLPMLEEYDEVVNDYILTLKYAIKRDKEYDINYNIMELCNHYIMNKELYKFD